MNGTVTREDFERADIDGKLGLLGICPTLTEVFVRDFDNDNHTITIEQYKQMCLELVEHVMTIRQGYWANVDTCS